jgi:hypothetical protein
MIAATIATGAVARAQAPTASGQSPFGFHFEESESHRGVAVEGYVYNTLPWRITNVRLLDSIDANGMLIAPAWGWARETWPPVVAGISTSPSRFTRRRIPTVQ